MAVSQISVSPDATFQVFREMYTRVEVFWVVTPCSDGVGYQSFLHLQDEHGGSKILRNVSVLPH
jgi:hypothetical protein